MSLRVFRNRPAVATNVKDEAKSTAAPKEWNTKEVTRFLEKQGLNAYSPAAKIAKIRGSHLLNAAAMPFFNYSPPPSPLSSSAPPTPTQGDPVLRPSVSSPNFGTLTRSKSFMFGPSVPGSSSCSTGNSQSEALSKLCDQLGILSVVDRRRLWLALLMLHRQQADSAHPLESPYVSSISQSEKTIATKGARPRPMSTYAPLVSLKTKQQVNEKAQEAKEKQKEKKKGKTLTTSGSSGEEEATGERKRSSSFSAVPLDTNSGSFLANEPTSPTSIPSPITPPSPPRLGSSPAIVGQVSPLSPAARKRSDTVASPKADASPATPKDASRKRRAAIGPKMATLRKWIMPSSPQPSATVVSPPTTPSPPRSPPRSPSKGKKRKASRQGGNPGLSYAESHGVVVVKCCLQASALMMDYDCTPTKEYDAVYDQTEQDEGGEEDQHQHKKTSKKRKEETYYDDISMLRLDAKKVLFADLMWEIQRLHGPLLMSLLVKDGAHGIKISYKDGDGDVVNVQSDDSLRYALEDWQKAASTKRTQNGRGTFMRLVVEVEPKG